MLKTPFILISFIFFQLSQASVEYTNRLVNLTDRSFDYEIKQAPNSKWLLVFHVTLCKFCRNTVETILNEVAPQFESNSKVRFGFIDCDTNVWLATRFNISMVPYTILVENGKMIELKKSPSKSILLEFLKEEFNIEDMKTIPEPFSYYAMLTTLFREFFVVSQEYMQKQFDKWNFTYFKWNNYLTGIGLIAGFFSVLLIESFVLSMLCRTAKTKNKNNASEEKEKKKENEIELEEKKEDNSHCKNE